MPYQLNLIFHVPNAGSHNKISRLTDFWQRNLHDIWTTLSPNYFRSKPFIRTWQPKKIWFSSSYKKKTFCTFKHDSRILHSIYGCCASLFSISNAILFSCDTRYNHIFMTYIMNVVTNKKKAHLTSHLTLFEILIHFLLLFFKKPTSRHHICCMYLYFLNGDHVMTLIKRHSQWLFHFSKGFSCVRLPIRCKTNVKWRGKNKNLRNVFFRTKHNLVAARSNSIIRFAYISPLLPLININSTFITFLIFQFSSLFQFLFFLIIKESLRAWTTSSAIGRKNRKEIKLVTLSQLTFKLFS